MDYSDNFYRVIFEESPIPMVILSHDTKICLVNASFCKLSHYSKEELIGISWISKTPPDEVEKLVEYNKRRLENDPSLPTKYDTKFFDKHGKLLYLVISVSLIQKSKHIIVNLTDITERKVTEEAQRISEERYRSMIEFANDVIFSVSEEGVFKYVSPNWKEYLGHDPKEVVGHPFDRYVSQEVCSEIRDSLKNLVETGEKLTSIEIPVRHKNGEWLWFSTSLAPFTSETGESSLIGIAIDITERKIAEEELNKNEALLNTIVQNSPDMIWLKDELGKFIFCNQKLAWLTGVKKEDIIGNTDYEILDKDIAEQVRKNDLLAIEYNHYRNEEWLYVNPLKKKLLFDTIKTPVYDTKEKLIGVLGIARDITERKKLEKQLAEKIYFFQQSQRAGNIGSFKMDFETQIWESSAVLDFIFGIDESYTKNYEGWINLIHPEDKENIRKHIRNAIDTKQKQVDLEYRIIRNNDKNICWLKEKAEGVFDKTGGIVSYIGTIRDITDWKLSEQEVQESRTKLEIALKIAHLGPWEYDVSTSLFYFNDTFYAMYKSNTEKVGSSTMSAEEYANMFVHPEDRFIVAQELKKALVTEESFYTCREEHRIIYSDGNIGYIVVLFHVIKDENGKTIKIFGINQDITAIKLAEKELQDNTSRLAELNSMKDKFFSIIAHDLRSPFNTIVGFSSLLIKKIKDEKFNEAEVLAQNILDSSELTMDLLANLMDWSRNETGRLDFNPQHYSLTNQINKIVELFSPTASQKDISLNLLNSDDILIYADFSMIDTVIRNLISNAIKFTYQGGQITINTSETNNKTLVEVTDSGVGIEEENIKKLFRIDKNYSTEGTQYEKGTGLGLTLCKEFIEKHGGEISVTSELGKGSVFSFTIPTNQDY